MKIKSKIKMNKDQNLHESWIKREINTEYEFQIYMFTLLKKLNFAKESDKEMCENFVLSQIKLGVYDPQIMIDNLMSLIKSKTFLKRNQRFKRKKLTQNYYQSFKITNKNESKSIKKGANEANLKIKPEDTIFAKIVRKEIKSNIVYEDDKVLCIKDNNPVAPFHFLVLPKKPISGIGELKEEDVGIAGHCLYVAAKVAKDQGFGEDGYRLVINQGKHSQQSVAWMHVHIIGGKFLGWPPFKD